jgi:lysophospholipase L1-like esterase
VRARLLLLLAGTLAGLLLGEVTLRLLGLGPPGAPRRVVYRGESREWCCGPEEIRGGVHRFEPRGSFAHCYHGAAGLPDDGCVTYRINAEGYRGPEFSVAKPADAYRIVILGDSFTFGEGTPDALIYPALLAEALRERRAGGRRIEVVNLGVPGDDVGDALVTYRRYARRLGGDFVVLQWNTNDFPSDRVRRDHHLLIGAHYRELFQTAEALRWSRLLSFAYTRLRTWQLSRELVATTRSEVETRSDAFAAIGRLRHFVRQDGAGFAVLAFPELIRFDAYPYAALLELLREYCGAQGIPLIDLLPALSAHRDRELWVHETDHHPNRLAHAIAARELAQALAGQLLAADRAP